MRETSFRGEVEVIVGSMFSGKTEELIRILRRSQFAHLKIQVFKPRIDVRYSIDHVATHKRELFPSITIDHAVEIYAHLRPETQVIGIDEGQFFDDELVDVANELADRGLRIFIAGLDLDWKGEPFHPMPALLAIADNVKKLRAVCVVCGATASRTQRLVKDTSSVLIGDQTVYEARCRACFDPSLALSAENSISPVSLSVALESRELEKTPRALRAPPPPHIALHSQNAEV